MCPEFTETLNGNAVSPQNADCISDSGKY